jgi:hypothetical protein
MTVKSIPVNLTGLGSQPPEEDGSRLEFISLPTEMSRYRAPDIPEPEQISHLQGAKAVTGCGRHLRPTGSAESHGLPTSRHWMRPTANWSTRSWARGR